MSRRNGAEWTTAPLLSAPRGCWSGWLGSVRRWGGRRGVWGREGAGGAGLGLAPCSLLTAGLCLRPSRLPGSFLRQLCVAG